MTPAPGVCLGVSRCARWLVPVCALAALSAAAPPTLDQVLELVTRYVARYEEQLGSLLADERYVQEAVWHRPGSGYQQINRGLASEFLILRIPGSDEWLAFRDVAQVDGKAVAEKPSLFSVTLGDESRPLGDRLRDLVAASARHNIGEIQRTINLPTFALIVVREENIGRFRFSRDRETSVRGVRSWVLRYVERQRPTIVRGDQGRDVILQGLLWVDPATGRILRTMLSTHDALTDLHATIEVDYRADPRLDLWLPAKMREIYQHRRRHTVRAEAEYRNYRRFEVEVKVRGVR